MQVLLDAQLEMVVDVPTHSARRCFFSAIRVAHIRHRSLRQNPQVMCHHIVAGADYGSQGQTVCSFLLFSVHRHFIYGHAFGR